MPVHSTSLGTACKGRAWEDPSVYGINKRSAHVELNAFRTVDDAVKYVSQIGRELSAKPQNCSKQMLNGKWNFKLFPSPDDVPMEFMNSDIGKEWSLIQVPGNWETQGFGRPVYTNFKYPFDVNPPYMPSDNPTGCYITSFTVESEAMSANHLSLVFDGVDSAFGVWLNSTFVGYSQDSRLPAEFSICDFCSPGTNTLAVQVMKWSDGSYLEDQDMWCLSGIFRDVYILQRPKQAHITDYHLQTPLQLPQSGAPAASLKAEVHVSAEDAQAIKETTIKMQLFGEVTLGTEASSPELIASVEAPAEAVWSGNDTTGQPNAKSARCGGRVVLDIPSEILQGKVSLWSAEQPTVYCVVLEVCSAGVAEASVPHVEAAQLAFRQSSIVDGKLVHNGAPIMLRGVNRHEHDQYNGKVVSEESMLADILLMKQANFNAVRMSHYPNTQRFYQLCTALGLYAIDEANLETHGFDAALCKNYLNPANSQLWSTCMLDRAVRMFEQNKNHGCIIAWSIGNESGYGPVHAAMSAFIRHRDPSRVMHYEGGGSCTPATDLICPMYARRQQIESMAHQNSDRPIVLCEYAHAMGNSGGGLADYWRLFESNERCQGGFIWDWVDQGLMMKKGMPGYAGQEYWCYGGDFGDPVHDAQFCINGLMFPNRQPHPSLHEIKHVQAPIHFNINLQNTSIEASVLQFDVCVRNRYDFSDLQHVLLQWRLTVNGVPVDLSLGKGNQSVIPQEFGVPAVPAIVASAAAPACLALNTAQHDPQGAEEQAWQDLTAGDVNTLKPTETASVHVAVTADQLQALASVLGPEGDTFLEVRAVTQDATFWAPQGHKVVCTQSNVSSQVLKAVQCSQLGTALLGPSHSQDPPSVATMLVQSSDASHTVSLVSDGSVYWEATVENSSGMLSSWKKGEFDVMQGPAELSLVRAPTDNDLGGSDGTSHAARWLSLGLDRELVASSCTVSLQHLTDTRVALKVECEMTATGRRVMGEASASGGASLEVGGAHWFAETQGQEAVVEEQEAIDGTIALIVEYEFTPDGVSMQWQVDISRFMPAQSCGHINSLARIGMRLKLPAELQKCAWLGRGPHENYIDRQDGALVRFYSADVSTLHTPYLAPSENGGRGGTRWMALMPQQDNSVSSSQPGGGAGSTQAAGGCPVVLAAAVPVRSSESCQPWPQDGGDSGKAPQVGAAFCPRDGLHFSASHHSTEDLFAAKHNHELPEGGPCYLHLDGMHMGIGGDDSWTPSVHTPYLIRKGVYKFAVALKLLDGNTGVEEVVQSASSMRARSAVKPA